MTLTDAISHSNIRFIVFVLLVFVLFGLAYFSPAEAIKRSCILNVRYLDLDGFAVVVSILQTLS